MMVIVVIIGIIVVGLILPSRDARQPACEHRRVLGVRSIFVVFVSAV